MKNKKRSKLDETEIYTMDFRKRKQTTPSLSTFIIIGLIAILAGMVVGVLSAL